MVLVFMGSVWGASVKTGLVVSLKVSVQPKFINIIGSFLVPVTGSYFVLN
jgi:hypothetical protein